VSDENIDIVRRSLERWKRIGAPVVVVAVALAGCGSDNTQVTKPKTTTSSSVREVPSFKSAERACQALRSDSPGTPTVVARTYAREHAPLALREEVYKGCLAGLTK
jgi:hypothetical protein